MTKYAEASLENGAIIALDQEKAYDKINHQYLWEVLHKFGLPGQFVKTIKSLYQNTESVVILNSETN